jgi:hypothetical protein
MPGAIPRDYAGSEREATVMGERHGMAEDS